MSDKMIYYYLQSKEIRYDTVFIAIELLSCDSKLTETKKCSGNGKGTAFVSKKYYDTVRVKVN
jgi:hypothetical protein